MSMKSAVSLLAIALLLGPAAFAEKADDLHASFPTADGREIDLDFTNAPELKDWGMTQVAPVLVEWYPKLIAMLPSPGFQPAPKISIDFEQTMKAAAVTRGARITANVTRLR